MSAPPLALAACRRLIEVARAQGETLERGDVDGFENLTAERAHLQQVVEMAGPDELAPALRDLLLVAELDRQNLASLRALLHQTGLELGRLRRGRTALGGYARPQSARIALVDRAG